MSGTAGHCGAALISWSQTQIDGHVGLPETAIGIGAYWRWSGQAVDLGCAADLADPDGFETPEEFRRHAAAATRRVVGQALGFDATVSGAFSGDRTFTLSDGRDTWIATLIEVPDIAHPLLMFAGRTPPPETPLRIDWVETRADPHHLSGAAGVVCFTPGTWIDTPRGARQIEHLSAGDKVVTLDGGVQELIWIGTRRLTLRELRRTPDVAPVRIREGALDQRRADGDLIVSPDHRMLIRGPCAESGEQTEVLVSARDLVDGKGVLRESAVRPVTYVHLLLETHQILLANGYETESFHPGAAPLHAVPEPQRLCLFDVMPILRIEPAAYGPAARPVLSQAEAALLSAA